MKKIMLSPYREGVYTVVDDEDFEHLSQWKWKHSKGYALRSTYDSKLKKYKNIYMHRLVARTPKSKITDHIDRNKLNNTRANLRVADKSLNTINRNKRPDNTSGFVGVYKYYPREYREKGWNMLWSAQVYREGKAKYLGYFRTPELAHRARIEYLRMLKS